VKGPHGGLKARLKTKERGLDLADGQGAGLHPLGPLAGRAGVGWGSSRRAVEGGGGVRKRPCIRMMQDAVSPHPATDQDEEPGRRAGEQVLRKTGACHGLYQCTLTSTEIGTGKVPGRRFMRRKRTNGKVSMCKPGNSICPY